MYDFKRLLKKTFIQCQTVCHNEILLRSLMGNDSILTCMTHIIIVGMSMTLDVLFSRCKSMRYKCNLFSMHISTRTCFHFPIYVPNRNGEYMFPQTTFTFKYNVILSCLMKHIEVAQKTFEKTF